MFAYKLTNCVYASANNKYAPAKGPETIRVMTENPFNTNAFDKEVNEKLRQNGVMLASFDVE